MPGSSTHSPARIAVDLRLVGKPGIGHYATQLFAAVLDLDTHNHYVFIAPRGWNDKRFRRANATVLETSMRYYSIQEQVLMPVLLKRKGIDLFHSPHFLLQVILPCKSVVSILDAIYLTFPDDLRNPVARAYYEVAFRVGAWRSDRIITISNFSKAEIIRTVGVDPKRIAVTQLAAARNFHPVSDDHKLMEARAALSLPPRYFLYIGIQRHRKNIPRIILAFHQLLQAGDCGHHLVLAGKSDPRYRHIPELVERLGIGDRVHFVGYVTDEMLPALYSLADALVFPSLYEGFGLPVLEAMACGTPVITSNSTCLPEVAGDAALLVDPTDTSAIVNAMRRILTDQEGIERLRRLGFARAKNFSWEMTARQTLEVYRDVLN